MPSLYYAGQYLGEISHPENYPGGFPAICQALSPDEGLCDDEPECVIALVRDIFTVPKSLETLELINRMYCIVVDNGGDEGIAIDLEEPIEDSDVFDILYNEGMSTKNIEVLYRSWDE